MKKNMDNTIHLCNLTIPLLSMFVYDNLPDTLPAWLIETMLITDGVCGVCRMDDGNLYTGTGGYCGDVVNFLPTEYQITNVGVGSKRGKIGTDFAVGRNNSTWSPDWYVMQTADILTEIDTSERCNVLFSRLLRIPKVKDSAEKKAVEECVKALMDGRFAAVTSSNVLQDLVDTDSNNKFLDLADVKDVDHLQYLNQYRDNVVKRYYQIYGQGMQTTAKMAQQTTDELHGSDTVACINVMDRLKCREEFVETINKIFGTNISVKFSECWQDSVDEMRELYSDGSPDDTPTGEEEPDGNEEDTPETQN